MASAAYMNITSRSDSGGPPYKRGRYDEMGPPSQGKMMSPQQVQRELAARKELAPNRVIVVQIFNAVHPIDMDVVYKVFSRYGLVCRAVIFNRISLNVMIEYDCVSAAQRAVEELHGSDIYKSEPRCCTMKIEFGKKDHLEVKRNSETSWDFTIEPWTARDTSSSEQYGLQQATHPSNSMYPPLPPLPPPYGQTSAPPSGRRTLLYNPPWQYMTREREMSPNQVERELHVQDNNSPNKILLYTIMNTIFPISTQLIYNISSHFGKVSKIIIFERFSIQAMVEFATFEGAISAKQNLNQCDIYPNCCTLKVDFAKKEKLDVDRNNHLTWSEEFSYTRRERKVVFDSPPLVGIDRDRMMPDDMVESEIKRLGRTENTPSRILLMYILNATYPINCDVVYKMVSPISPIVRIVIFERVSIQVMVEFETEEDASKVLKELDESDIYPKCCTVKIEYGKKDRLVVHQNDSLSWDFTLGNLMDGNRKDINDFEQTRRKRVTLLDDHKGREQLQSMDQLWNTTWTDRELEKLPKSNKPQRVLLLTVMNCEYPVDCEVMFRVCCRFGLVLRIVIFRRVSIQVFVEFATQEEATQAKINLHGSNIYDDCNTIKAEYAMKEALNADNNNIQNCWDFTKDPDITKWKKTGSEIPQNRPPMYGSPFPSASTCPPGPYDSPWMNRSGAETYWPTGSAAKMPGPDQMSGGWGGGYVHGGELNRPGAVCMVYNLNNEIFTCQRLFNLLCPFGNVQRILFLKQKDFKTAIVEWSDSGSVERARDLLCDVHAFDQRIEIEPSKKQSLSAGRDGETKLWDGTNAFQDFTESRRNRFNHNSNFSNIFPPSRTLHFFNTPDLSDDDVKQIFRDLNSPEPSRVMWFPKKGGKSKGAGCLQFSDVTQASEALVLANYAKVKGGEIWLAFTREREDRDF